MNKKGLKFKIYDHPLYEGIHIWYSKVDKAVVVNLSVEKWDIEPKDNESGFHIYKKRD